MRQRSTFIVLRISLVGPYEASSPTLWTAPNSPIGRLEYYVERFRVRRCGPRSRLSRSGYRSCATPSSFQDLPASLKRGSNFIPTGVEFMGKVHMPVRRGFTECMQETTFPSKGTSESVLHACNSPTGRHNARGPQVYKGCRSSLTGGPWQMLPMST